MGREADGGFEDAGRDGVEVGDGGVGGLEGGVVDGEEHEGSWRGGVVWGRVVEDVLRVADVVRACRVPDGYCSCEREAENYQGE